MAPHTLGGNRKECTGRNKFSHTVCALSAGRRAPLSSSYLNCGDLVAPRRTSPPQGGSCTVLLRPAALADGRQSYGKNALLRSAYILVLTILSRIEDKISAVFAIVWVAKGLSDSLTRSQSTQSPDAPDHKVRYLWFRRSDLWIHTN
jgi:hypothetical protein